MESILGKIMINETEYICCFCEKEMAEEQIFCCRTYKGKMTLEDFNEYYG